MDSFSNTTVSVSKMRILIVDGNEDAAELLAMLVAELGYESAVALSASEAMQQVHIFMPDVAFINTTLPDATGAELANEIRAIPVISETILVATTGHGWGGEESADFARFNHILYKPLSMAVLSDLLSIYDRVRLVKQLARPAANE